MSGIAGILAKKVSMQVSKWLIIIIVFLIAGYGLYVRMENAYGRGMTNHGDSWKYHAIAKEWAQGKPVWMHEGGYYRPAIHLLHALAIRAMGWNDYSLKVLHSMLDTGTLLLLFVLGWRLSRSCWVGVAAMLPYLAPTWILNTQVLQEFPHGPSTFFVILAALFTILGVVKFPRARYGLLGLAGLSQGIAVNMHADLGMLGLGFVVVIAVCAIQGESGWGRRLIRITMDAGIFTVAFFTPHVLGIACFGFDEVYRVISAEFSIPRSHYRNSPVSESPWFAALAAPGRLLLAVSNGEVYGSVLLYIGLFIAAIFPVVGLRKNAQAYLPVALIVSYCGLYPILIGTLPLRMSRLLMPLAPMMILTAMVWLYLLFHHLRAKVAAPLVLCISLLLMLNSPNLLAQPLPPHKWRVVSNLLREKVDQTHRLLVLPLSAHFAQESGPPFRPWCVMGFPNEIYFGQNAMYLTEADPAILPYSTSTLEKLCQEKQIRYIFVETRDLESHNLFVTFPQFERFADGTPYSLEKDREIIARFMRDSSAAKVFDYEGGIYELPEAGQSWENIMRDRSARIWDFMHLPTEQWEWLFPGGVKQKRDLGSLSTTEFGKDTWVTLSGAHIDASNIRGIWIEWGLDNKYTSETILERLPVDDIRVFWAREDDFKKGEWPFSEKRAVDGGRIAGSNIFAAYPELSHTWEGTITTIGLRLIVPDGTKGFDGNDAHLMVQRIGLLKSLLPK